MLEIKKKKSLKLLKYCVSEAKICEEGPCLNGGICVGIENDDFICLCPNYFTGKKCECNNKQ